MSVLEKQIQPWLLEIARFFSGLMVASAILMPLDSQALPAFARQTGQNCVSCHAGGQFPELTPYGRMFKLTGYTIGSRSIPLSVMGVFNYAKVSDTTKSDDPSVDFQKNGVPVFSGGSLFIAGKVTDNIGLFSQITYDNFASQSPDGKFQGHSSADNIDLRYADRFIDNNRDLIIGLSVNNNPSVSDPWNTTAAWMQYVPAASLSSHQFSDANTPFPSFDAHNSPLAGINAYVLWNKMIYADLGFYRTANRAFSIMSAGTNDDGTQKLRGTNNPYWRLALTHDWGAHNLMIGTSGMIAHAYDPGSDISDPGNLGRFKNVGVDAQYQYLLDPHTVTAQVAYMRQTQTYSANAFAAAAPPFVLGDGITPVASVNPSDTTNIFRAKLSYVYQATYGGSVAFFNKTGTINTLNQTSGYDPGGCGITNDPECPGVVATSLRVNGNLLGSPAARGMTYELFWTPLQYVRVGAMYTAYNKFNGASDNYDGLGRNARDNNTLFGYVWFAY
ncbi:MAG: cytochrome C [Proteobacteria bacterium]|nr:cytochrome C [Pseudomonadota bacterium]